MCFNNELHASIVIGSFECTENGKDNRFLDGLNDGVADGWIKGNDDKEDQVLDSYINNTRLILSTHGQQVGVEERNREEYLCWLQQS